jgi:hypothetical protein
VGFLDKLKGTAKQMVNPVGQAGVRSKIMKINESGVERQATVDSMKEVGSSFGGGHEVQFELTVEGEGGPYKVSTTQTMHDVTLKGVEQGGRVVVKVDPDDPQSLLVWGPAS